MGFMDYLKDMVGNGVSGFIREAQHEFARNIAITVKRIERHLIKELAGVMILLAALVFLAIAGFFFFVDYAGLNRTLSSLIIGCVLLLIGIIFRLVK
jgi:hypothetical protein